MFRKLRNIRNQGGFSIIQGIFLAGAVAGMALVGTKLTTNQKLAQKGVDSKNKVEQFHSMIYSMMQNKEHCTETFAQNGIGSSGSTNCYAGTAAANQACDDLGGAPGGMIPSPIDTQCDPGSNPADTVCIYHSPDHDLGGPCDWATRCHAVPPGAGENITGTQPIASIWTQGASAAIFRVNTNAGTDDYDPALVYMNNSVSINAMNVIFPADLSQHADFEIFYGKLDDKDSGSRTGKGFGGKANRKVIKLKIQRDSTTNKFESCYAVNENENQDMIKDFCEGLGADGDPSSPNLFEWSETYQKCLLTDVRCPTGQIFTGFDSNGQRLCYAIQDWMNFSDFLDTSTANSCNSATYTNVGFILAGNKVQIQCDGSPIPCATPCDCPTATYTCDSNFCVDRGASCVPGEWGKGDMSFQYECSAAGFWQYSANPACGGSCLPVVACPDRSSGGYSVDARAETSGWGEDPSLSETNYCDGLMADCTEFIRNNTTCSDLAVCTYTKTCTPVRDCADKTADGYTFSSRVEGATWMGDPTLISETDCNGITTPCKESIRNATSCSSAAETVYCHYTKTTCLGTQAEAENACSATGGTIAGVMNAADCLAAAANPSRECYLYNSTACDRGVVCNVPPPQPDGTRCMFGGSDIAFGVYQCSQCENQPSVLNSMCCDAPAGYQGLYRCGMPDMVDCYQSPGMTQPPIPAGGAPPQFECDT